MSYEFNHVHLKAPDPKKTADWYVKAFNFKIVGDIVRPVGDRFIRCQTADGVGVNISGARSGETLDPGNAGAHWGIEHFGVNVGDIEAEIKRLTDLGAKLLEGPNGNKGELRIAFIKGPDDTRIELLQQPPAR
ncbi:MAG: VOC family protein [Chloroflexi bacterium]|nr:VOC family protein [Chloroflexota bacterium]